jgi:hypothetical protein
LNLKITTRNRSSNASKQFKIDFNLPKSVKKPQKTI